MKIVQSYWSKPGQAITKADYAKVNQCGWIDKRYHYFSWALSSLLMRKYYDRVELVTDAAGYDMLIEKMKLPFTGVSVVLDELNDYHADLFALGKIYAYSIQEEPFLHVDADVFIGKKFSADLENAELACQSPEVGILFDELYGERWTAINEHFEYYPEVLDRSIERNKRITGLNAGVLGGNDISFFKEFASLAFEFIERNVHGLSRINVWKANVIFEQFLCKALAEEKNMKIRFYSEGIEYSPFINQITDMVGMPSRTKYVHLYSGYKKFPHSVNCLEYNLRTGFPDFYYRILNLIHTHQL